MALRIERPQFVRTGEPGIAARVVDSLGEIAEVRLRADLWTGYYDLERAVGGFDGSMDESEDGQ